MYSALILVSDGKLPIELYIYNKAMKPKANSTALNEKKREKTKKNVRCVQK